MLGVLALFKLFDDLTAIDLEEKRIKIALSLSAVKYSKRFLQFQKLSRQKQKMSEAS